MCLVCASAGDATGGSVACGVSAGYGAAGPSEAMTAVSASGLSLMAPWFSLAVAATGLMLGLFAT